VYWPELKVVSNMFIRWGWSIINPGNLMVEGDEVVIIDFGSCRWVGESLEGVGTMSESTLLSQRMTFLYAPEEIRIWLGDGSRLFLFDTDNQE
jgi:hypothetical protein